MTLAALIGKRESGKVATAIPAISATQEGGTAGTVARIATVAVASPQNTKAEGVDLTALLVEACQDVEGIDAATFRALLSPQDVEDIEGGHIPMVTLNAYAQSFAEGIRSGRIACALWRVPALRAGHHRGRARDRALQDRRRRDGTEIPGTLGERRA